MDTPPVIVNKTVSNSLTKNSLTPCRRVGLGRPPSGSFNRLVHVRTILSTPPHDSSNIAKQNSIQKISANVVNVTPDVPSRVSPKQNGAQNRILNKSRRCLTQNIKSNELQSAKRRFQENEVETNSVSNEITTKRVRPSLVNGSNYSGNSQVDKLNSELLSEGSKTNAKGYENINPLVGLCEGASTKISADCSLFEKNEDISEDIIAQLVLSLLKKKDKLEQLKVQETYAKKHNLEELRIQSAKWREAGQEALRHCVRLAKQVGHTVTILQLMVQHGFPPDLMGYNVEDDEFD